MTRDAADAAATPGAAVPPAGDAARDAPLALTGPHGWIAGRVRAAAGRRGTPVRDVERADLATDDALARALAGCGAVVHLAAIAHRPRGTVDDGDFDAVNHRLALRIASVARESGVRRFVFVSSAKVMGERSPRPFVETDPPAPADAYARSKLAAERALLALHAPGRFDVVVARPPLVYGAGARANFAALVRLARRPWPLPLANATATRSLVHVDNLADALVFLCTNAHAAGGTYFVADGTEVSVARLVGRVRELQGRSPRLFPMPRALRAVAATLGRVIGADPSPIFERLFEPLQVDASALRALGWRPPLQAGRALDATLRSLSSLPGEAEP
ncbi:MAG: NAD-dependent epimerase/dehydratase family protein [Burkholderiaceae bacterium]